MNTKHTPGPWTAESDGNVNAYSSPTCHICKVNGGLSKEQNTANTRLIAAAPDLLAALESFLRAPSIGSSGPGSISIEVQSYNRQAALAAIAKATHS